MDFLQQLTSEIFCKGFHRTDGARDVLQDKRTEIREHSGVSEFTGCV